MSRDRTHMHQHIRSLRFPCPDIKGVSLLIAVWIGVLILSDETARAEDAPIFEARVSKVLDGDTFTLKGEPRRIRIWGLEAPEWNDEGGSHATSTLRNLISGEYLRCAVVDVDRYGRLVAQCVQSDGSDIGAAMIASGAATEYCKYSGGYYGTC